MSNLTDVQRRCIVDELLKRSICGDLPHGAKAAVTRDFERSRSAVSKIWARYRLNIEAGVTEGEWRSRIRGNSDRKKKSRAQAVELLQAVPVEDRSVERRAASLAGVSRHLIRALVAEDELARVTARIRPILTEENRLVRVEHVLSFIDDSTLFFEPMDHIVHVDEKWFYEDKDKRSYLLFPGEEPPHRTRKSKRFIPKTMFLAAVARPRYGSHRKCQWDGKLGLWPLTEEYVAQRRSRNRLKGAVCTRNIDVVNRDVYKDYLLRCVIPAIKEQWPRGQRRHPIMIQQDNAKAARVSPRPRHCGGGDGRRVVYSAAVSAPHSPDLNVLDLGLFNAIQSIQNRLPIHGIDNLITAIQNAYTNMDTDTLDNISLTLQGCMLCILQESGGNRYALPHIGKEALRRKGILPRVLKCDQHLYDSAKACLVEAGRPSLIFFDPAE